MSKGYVTGTEQTQKVFSMYIPGLRQRWSYARYIPGIYHVYIWYRHVIYQVLIMLTAFDVFFLQDFVGSIPTYLQATPILWTPLAQTQTMTQTWIYLINRRYWMHLWQGCARKATLTFAACPHCWPLSLIPQARMERLSQCPLQRQQPGAAYRKLQMRLFKRLPTLK